MLMEACIYFFNKKNESIMLGFQWGFGAFSMVFNEGYSIKDIIFWIR